MNIQSDAPIIQKVYDFYRSFYEQADHFPKKAREVLVAKIEQVIIELLELLSTAGVSSASTKLQYLNRASIKLDFLKTLIRLMYELKIINQSKYLEIQEQLHEIGKMLGGWIKSVKG